MTDTWGNEKEKLIISSMQHSWAVILNAGYRPWKVERICLLISRMPHEPSPSAWVGTYSLGSWWCSWYHSILLISQKSGFCITVFNLTCQIGKSTKKNQLPQTTLLSTCYTEIHSPDLFKNRPLQTTEPPSPTLDFSHRCMPPWRQSSNPRTCVPEVPNVHWPTKPDLATENGPEAEATGLPQRPGKNCGLHLGDPVSDLAWPRHLKKERTNEGKKERKLLCARSMDPFHRDIYLF